MRYCILIGIVLHFLCCDIKAQASEQPATVPDSVRDAQILYNGVVWTNLYYRVREDQFFLSKDLLPGTVSIGGKSFPGQRIKYDIYNDEIMIPNRKGLVLQLNKEMVDSFTLGFNDRIYRFENFRNDTTSILNGYVNVLCRGKCSLYVKYRKEIELLAVDRKYDRFFQQHRIFAEKDGIVYPLKSQGDFYKITGEAKAEVKAFVKKNKYLITRRNPESFLPAVLHYNTLLQ